VLTAKMLAVVLPGLDGVPELRAEFIAALAPEIEANVIAFPTDQAMGYEELLPFVAARLPHGRPFLLIGESFSGPLAIRLASMRPEGLAGLVLCASFAKTPVPLASVMRRFVAMLPLKFLPTAMVLRVMMGRWSTPQWGARLRHALDNLESATLRKRIVEVLAVDATQSPAQISCPMLEIQAASDTLLCIGDRNGIVRAKPDVMRIVIDGPHMLLQAHPQSCANAIKRWLSIP
jgi:pimeloyl-ACP methyl ester carboxylesterase